MEPYLIGMSMYAINRRMHVVKGFLAKRQFECCFSKFFQINNIQALWKTIEYLLEKKAWRIIAVYLA